MSGFLPINAEDMHSRGWSEVDFVYVSGDAYVDHPSFGAAIITRVLEAAGYKVGFLSQPDWHSAEDFKTSADRSSVSWSAPAISTPWSRTIQLQKSAAIRTHILRAAKRACDRTEP